MDAPLKNFPMHSPEPASESRFAESKFEQAIADYATALQAI
jgi:hypothetical protein